MELEIKIENELLVTYNCPREPNKKVLYCINCIYRKKIDFKNMVVFCRYIPKGQLMLF